MNAKLKKRKAARAGRKPVAGVAREPSGRLAKRDRRPLETQEQVLATATAQPHRKGASDPRSPFLGYSIGRLFMTRKITREQMDAAIWYAGLSAAYRREVLGLTIRSQSASLSERIASSGWSASNDNSPSVDADRLRARWEQVQDAIAAACQHYVAYAILLSVCTYDEGCAESDLPILHKALNAVRSTLDGQGKAVQNPRN